MCLTAWLNVFSVATHNAYGNEMCADGTGRAPAPCTHTHTLIHTKQKGKRTRRGEIRWDQVPTQVWCATGVCVERKRER